MAVYGLTITSRVAEILQNRDIAIISGLDEMPHFTSCWKKFVC
jgi:hypothetical protein